MSKMILGDYACPICGSHQLYFEEVIDADAYYEMSCIFCNSCKAMITSELVEGTTEKDEQLLLNLIRRKNQ